MFGWLKKLLPVRTVIRERRVIRGSYDAAKTVADNRKHWAAADALSARLANSLSVRSKLRERARYESANNSYCRGIILTLANDLIGTGPRLQLTSANPEINRAVEQEFAAWSAAIGLADKLRVMTQAKKVDGEAFGILTTNPNSPSRVKLDLKLVECDQVTEPWQFQFDAATSDGITFDAYGNPSAYKVLKEHPSEGVAAEYSLVPARDMLHWFRTDRPGQVRGIPEITPALPLFAQLRRYTLAVIAAAETAADFTAMLEQPYPPNADTVEAVTDFSEQEITTRMLMAAPLGGKIVQMKAEQPTTVYDMFVRQILLEIARCLNIPSNVAMGDSSRHNYSSGRLDHQTYFKAINVERSFLELVLLMRIYQAWLLEASLVRELLPPDAVAFDLKPQWFWDGSEHVDPQKEATAAVTLLDAGLMTRASYHATRGEDWESIQEQLAKEKQKRDELKLAPAVQPAPPQPGAPADELSQDDVENVQNAQASGGLWHPPVNGDGSQLATITRLRAETTMQPIINLYPTFELSPQITVQQPDIIVEPTPISVQVAAPIVNVAAPIVNVEPAQVTVAAPAVTVNPPAVNVSFVAPPADVTVMPSVAVEKTVYIDNPDGTVTKARIVPKPE